MSVALAGEIFHPMTQRALFWPGKRTLIVADVHLGKGAAFRRAGVPVPSGSTQETLARLSGLLADTSSRRLLILGDLFHTQLEDDEPTFESFNTFREQNPELEIVAIRGNHDRGLNRLPVHWRLKWYEEFLLETPFVFAHEPRADVRGYVLAGHVHPIVRLRTRHDSLRLPTFWFGERVGVLPSFGAFTGGHVVTPLSGDRVIVVTRDGLVASSKEFTVEKA